MTTIDDLMAQLTTAERIGLLSGDGPWSVGGIERLGLPGIVLTDGPHGVRLVADRGRALDLDHAVPATCFPTAAALGSTWDAPLLVEVGHALGVEARMLGVDVLLGPGLNLKRHPRGGRSFEYLSEDPVVSGVLAGAMVRGIQGEGVAACLKHLAVNNQESGRMALDVVVDPRTLHELYLTGFEIAVEEGRPWTVMCAYNRVGGTYASQHAGLLTDVLRHRWGFDGVVLSDWGAVDDRLQGLRAGLDLEMPGGAGAHDARIARALDTGALAAADVDSAVRRVVHLIRRVRPPGVHRPEPPGAVDPATADRHHALARRVAAAATVLLKDAESLLPLDRATSVALIGPFADAPRYQGAGSSLVTPIRLDTLRAALADRVEHLTHDDGRRPARAAALAAAADVAVVAVGLPESYESEGFDRDHLRLPPEHDELVRAVAAANPRTVVVLSTGSPVVMPWLDDVGAVLTGYLGGQAGASGLADVLTGQAEPGGRLAESWPLDEADLPASANFPGPDRRHHPRQVEHREGLMVGYRGLSTLGRLPAFPFGHGLSYTRIELGRPRLSADVVSLAHLIDGRAVVVTLTATNVGRRSGSEVVQVYLRRPRSGVVRPDLELKAFAKVHLEPGESTEVTLRLGDRAFRHHGPAGWTVEEGPAEVLVGTSSAALPHRLALQVGAGSGSGPTVPPPALMDDEAFEVALGHQMPTPPTATGFTRNTTIGDLKRTAVGRRVRRALRKAVVGRLAPDASPATRLAVERAADELPLRALVLFSDGALTFDHLAVLLDVLEERWGMAGRRALKAFTIPPPGGRPRGPHA